jgi:5-(carboxyamino)imidazole ribonucleotide mutase
VNVVAGCEPDDLVLRVSASASFTRDAEQAPRGRDETIGPANSARVSRSALPVSRSRIPMEGAPLVGIIMGSKSDLETMRAAAVTLGELGINFELKIVSAHRTPDLMFGYAETAAERGLRVIIAGAGGAAHLPGMVAAKTQLPVIGVPVQSHALNGLDSLLSIVQMPAGVPVATMAIGNAANAALFAARILALGDPELTGKLAERSARIAQTVETTVL